MTNAPSQLKVPMGKGRRQQLRRKARRSVLQVLYEQDLAAHPLEEVLQRALKETVLDEENSAFVAEVAKAVVARQAALDDVIRTYAPAWPVAQLTAIDRNILRLGIYELLFGKGTPPKVAINEAVELAKEFGAEGSPRFVNGVLGSVLADQEDRKAELPPSPGQEEVEGAHSL